MLKKIYWKLKEICSISVTKYLFYNYLSKRVIRKSNGRVIPYKGAILEIQKGAKLVLNGGDLNVGINKIGKSKAETYIRIMRDATWECTNGASLFYGSTIEVHENAKLKTGHFLMNTGSVIVTAKEIVVGEDVLIGRDNVIYDSDFHPMLNSEGEVQNEPCKVKVGNHVWLTNHVMVQKGVSIGDGVVVSPFTVVRKDVPTGILLANGTQQICVKENICWESRKL